MLSSAALVEGWAHYCEQMMLESGFATAADLAIVAGHRELWVQDLCRAGYDRAFATAIWGALPQAVAAVTFTPTAAFQQTPGPAAGQPLGR